VIDDEQGLLVVADGDSVRLVDLVGDLEDGAVRVDPVDRPVFQLTRLGAQVAWVGEVDPALEIK